VIAGIAAIIAGAAIGGTLMLIAHLAERHAEPDDNEQEGPR